LGSPELTLQATLAWVGARRDALKMKRRPGTFSLIEAVGGRAAMVAQRQGIGVAFLGSHQGGDSGMEEESWGWAKLR
jgi:hypothetical protein